MTDPQFTQKYFSADERQIFRRHILWTRILSDRRTQLPDGHEGSLLDYVRREHESLVLKPNRSYGGQGIVIGHLLERAEWESAIDRALADSERWVVQQLASIPVSEFPVIGPDGEVHVEPFYTVMGFAPTQVRRGDPRPGLAEAGGQRGPARRHVRGADRPSAGAAHRPRPAAQTRFPRREVKAPLPRISTDKSHLAHRLEDFRRAPRTPSIKPATPFSPRISLRAGFTAMRPAAAFRASS